MRYITLALVFTLFTAGFAQNDAKFGTYYEQKKTLFALLPNDKDEIIFLGNSITDGCEWSELFRDPRIKNRGISADITEGILNRLDEVTESKPLQIFLMIGVNDLAHNISVERIITNYRTIISKILFDSPKTNLLIQSVLPVNDQFAEYQDHYKKSRQIVYLNSELKGLALEYDLEFIDLYQQFATSEGNLDPKYTNDGLHLTGSGYMHWKTIIEPYLIGTDEPAKGE